MGNCHYCFNCGRCRGEMPATFTMPLCVACGYKNEEGVTECVKCGTSLVLGGNNMVVAPGSSAATRKNDIPNKD